VRLLERHRSLIVEGLRDALAGETSLRRILRVHVGIEDEQGQPVDRLGKLLRPALVLFVADELGADPKRSSHAAVGLELIHNFSLIHDDIQDRDRTRRGRPTVWVRHGVPEAINAGDLMHAIAVSTALKHSPDAAGLLLQATDTMIEGQSLDLDFERRPVDIDEYLTMIDRKTGALLRCAFELGGLCAGVEADVREKLRRLGHEIGRAFQIHDDLLGIWGDGDVVGKPQGSDIRRRKKSFPVAVGFERADGADRERLERTYAGSDDVGDDVVDWVVDLLGRLGVRDEGERRVRGHLDAARAGLQEIPFSDEGRAQMNELIEYLARREK